MYEWYNKKTQFNNTAWCNVEQQNRNLLFAEYITLLQQNNVHFRKIYMNWINEAQFRILEFQQRKPKS